MTKVTGRQALVDLAMDALHVTAEPAMWTMTRGMMRTPEWWLVWCEERAKSAGDFLSEDMTDGPLTTMYHNVAQGAYVHELNATLNDWQRRRIRELTDIFRDTATLFCAYRGGKDDDAAKGARSLWNMTKASRDAAKKLINTLDADFVGKVHGKLAADKFRASLALETSDFNPLSSEALKKAMAVPIQRPGFMPYNPAGRGGNRGRGASGYRGRGRGRAPAVEEAERSEH